MSHTSIVDDKASYFMTCSQTLPTMQDTLLRVFVVALTLLMCPRDDPGMDEWDDITVTDMQEHEESLQGGGDKLEHKMALVIKEVTHTFNKTPHDGEKTEAREQSQSHQHSRQKMSVSDNVTPTKQEEDSGHHIITEGQSLLANVDHSWPQNAKAEAENPPETSDHEQMREDIQTDVSLSDPNKPQGQQRKTPEEKGVFNTKEQEPPQLLLHTRTSEKESSDEAISDWERDYLWYIWNTFSVISMIRLLRKHLGRALENKQENTRPFPVTCTAAEVLLPDNNTLKRFHSGCIQGLADKKCWEDAFLEGFARDLFDAMRAVCDRNGSIVIEDFQMVHSCDVIVPFRPSDPYGFQCLLRNNHETDLPDMQVCGQVTLVEKTVPNGCPCQSSDADDTVCLLHCDTKKVRATTRDVRNVLCTKNSPFLSKSQVSRLFQSTIKQAWAHISHKYEFELSIRYIDAPGALVVRFRSGRKINFTMNPVVKFNSNSYFFIPPCSPNMDTVWTLSLASYEDKFFKHIAKCFPKNSCHSQILEIAHFLHRKQIALTGRSALTDSHFKTALMHLLLFKEPSQWKPDNVASRLRDLLDFMERSLEKKLLPHALIGNPLTQKVVELPAELTQANAVNLFHPLVVHSCMYSSAVTHFQELLRNTHMLIHDYVAQCKQSAGESVKLVKRSGTI